MHPLAHASAPCPRSVGQDPEVGKDQRLASGVGEGDFPVSNMIRMYRKPWVVVHEGLCNPVYGRWTGVAPKTSVGPRPRPYLPAGEQSPDRLKPGENMINENVWQAMLRMADLAWKACYNEELREHWRNDWHMICGYLLRGVEPEGDIKETGPSSAGDGPSATASGVTTHPFDTPGMLPRTDALPRGKYSSALTGLANPTPGDLKEDGT